MTTVGPPLFGKLKDHILREYEEGQRIWPLRKELRAWMKEYSRHASDTRLTQMRKGKVVPWEVIEILADYSDLGAEFLAEPSADEPEAVDAEPIWWHLDWPKLAAYLHERYFSLPPLANCTTESDVRLAAEIIMECLGRYSNGAKEDSGLTKEQALTLGAQMMKLSLEQYTQCLLGWWNEIPHCIMFAVAANERRELERAGALVSLPLTMSAYTRFRKGLLDEFAFTKTDLQLPSNRLHTHAMAEVSIRQFRSRKAVANAQLSTMMHHISALCTGPRTRKIRPNMLTFAATPESRLRLVTKNFEPVGTFTPTLKNEIFELTAQNPNNMQSAIRRVQYEAMCLVFQLMVVIASYKHFFEHGDFESDK
jgi:hypothetical protein